MRPTPVRQPDPRLSNLVLEGGRSKAYPSWRCPLCLRTTHHPDDALNRYCPCCGSADGLLPKTCEHRGRSAMTGKPRLLQGDIAWLTAINLATAVAALGIALWWRG